jgi:hypothetical protein
MLLETFRVVLRGKANSPTIGLSGMIPLHMSPL